MSGFTTNPWQDSGGNKLLVTGQTTSHHAGDDGDLQKGVPHDFMVLTLGRYAGIIFVTVNEKTDALSNNCVKDNNTGLMWARYVIQNSIGPGTDGKLFWDTWSLNTKTTISFDAASKEIRDSASGFNTAALPAGRVVAVTGSTSNNSTFTVVSRTVSVIVVSEAVVNEAAGATVNIITVDDLIWDMIDQANTNSLGGHIDWRAPNKTELQSIVNLEHGIPCIDTTVFPSTPSGHFWTSSTRPGDPLRAVVVSFYNSLMGSYNKAQSCYHMRLVRGG